MEEIRETDDYPGLRLKLIASFERIREVVTVDVTTGDVITPKEVKFYFNRLFEDNRIELLSYPVETILSRGIGTTRPRDYYDVYILSRLQSDRIDFPVLGQALTNTMLKRHSVFNPSEYSSILDEIRENQFQQDLWNKYQKQFSYAREIAFEEIIHAIEELMIKIQL